MRESVEETRIEVGRIRGTRRTTCLSPYRASLPLHLALFLRVKIPLIFSDIILCSFVLMTLVALMPVVEQINQSTTKEGGGKQNVEESGGEGAVCNNDRGLLDVGRAGTVPR
jgi:hypothetical protein